MTTSIKIDSRKLLSRLANSQNSGCLKFDGGGLNTWKIYLDRGSLQYVSCSVQSLDQLKYYLHQLQYRQAISVLKSPSYVKIQAFVQKKPSDDNLDNLYAKVICWLLAENHLDRVRALKLLELITRDALQFCLWLERGVYSWNREESLPLWIRGQLGQTRQLNVAEYLNLEQIRLHRWQKCSTELRSVHQRPYFTTNWQQKPLPNSGSLNPQALYELSKLIFGRTSVRQLSLLLKKDELTIAQILSPYIDSKIISLRPAQPPLDELPSIPRLTKNLQQYSPINSASETKGSAIVPRNHTVKLPKIVCIDDSPTILKEMRRFLNREKFEIIALDDPVRAVPIIFRIEPDLILLDITMPRINGYKLCGLLRSSDNCEHTPIVMVTGNTGLIDKARAKLAGATDYLTKPFTQKSLMEIVKKHLN